MYKTPCFIVRGGTSKGVYFKESDMPQNKDLWPQFLLEVMGSPDLRQIDGLGGANSLTSKVAIVSKSTEPGIDLNYTFAQVGIGKAVVDMKGNCGNISSGVLTFALAAGLIEPVEPITKAMILNTNTNKLIFEEVSVKDGQEVVEGDCEIPGVPGTGSVINVSFYEPQGAVTKKLLPTGNATDIIDTSIGKVEISIVDSANPLVFMRAQDLGLTGTELPDDFTNEKLALVEEIRSIACEMCGFASRQDATNLSPAVPKATIISAAQDYTDLSNRTHSSSTMDIHVRMMSMQKPHKALAVTGSVCTATAAKTQGTLVNQLVPHIANELVIAHPGGIMRDAIKEENGEIKAVTVERTARVIMEGFVYVKTNFYK